MTEPTRPPPHSAQPADEPPLQRMAAQIDRETPDGAAFLNSLSDEDLALFAEAVALQREMEASMAQPNADADPHAVPHLEVAAEAMDAPAVHPADEERIPGVVPMRPRRKSASRAWLSVAAAAAILVFAVPFLRRSGAGLGEPSEYVAMLSQPNAGLNPEMQTLPGDPSRGSSDVTTDPGNAMRVGATVVNLELAIRAGDAAQTTVQAGRAVRYLQDIRVRRPEAEQRFTALAERAAAGAGQEALLADLAAASEAAERAVGRNRDFFALGAWAEAARVAAIRRDAAFFRSEEWRASLGRAERLLDDMAARTAIDAIRAAADPPQLDALHAAIDALFRAIA